MKFILKILFFPLIFVFYFIKRLNLKNALKKVKIHAIDSLNGYEFEKFISNVFFAFGYNATVTKKGADRGVDVIATRFTQKVAVQTKMYYNHNVSNSAIQQIYTAKEYFNANIAVVVTNSYFTKSAIELAEKLSVVLIDRTTLTSVLSGTNLKKFIG